MEINTREAVSRLSAYAVECAKELPDIHADGILLRHKKSGARVLLLPCDDTNRVFNIAFRTPPEDSTGVAHIIEHTVLCGSEKYPLKDPFVELAKGSLNTFLNAMTFPDKTMYPVASTNLRDFHNLVDVYLDAVFHPNIYREEKLFRQEGWHYHLEKEEDPLTYNGVVYNEMKGVYSSPDDLLERQNMNALFPDTAYGVESGGDPAAIPKLTYEAFLNFHRRYYHPSNSYIYLYGDLDMAKMLTWIDEAYLSRYEAAGIDSAIRLQKPFDGLRRVESVYPVSDSESLENNTYLALSKVVSDPFDAKESLAMEILDYALFSANGAPVKEALLKAGIGQDIDGAFNDGIRQPYYTITAKGANAEDSERFLSVIEEELKRVADNGIERKSLLAGINSLEFSYREADFSSYPKGLMYGIDAFDTWLYDDGRPFDAFCQLAVFRELREEASRPFTNGEKGYFEKLVEERFLNNAYGALVVMKPQKKLAQKREKQLNDKLRKRKEAMTPEEIRALVEETQSLIRFQQTEDSPENLKKLPMLKRRDLREKAPHYSNHNRRIGDVPVVFHRTVTNGIGYLTLLFDAGEVTEPWLPCLGLLPLVMGRVNTASYTYNDLDNEIGIHTGGISAGLSLYDDPDNAEGYRAYFHIRMKAVYGQLAKGLELIREILMSSDFTDTTRLREILMENKLQLQVALQQSGHTAASTRACACFSSEAAFRDMTGGIGFYKALGRLEKEFDERPEMLSRRLRMLQDILITRSNLLVSYTAEAEGYDRLTGDLPALLKSLPAGLPLEKRHILPPYGSRREAFVTSGQVQFAAQAGCFREAGSYNGHMLVLRHMLNYDYLWQNIRVTGGAYGCGAAFTRKGAMTLRTYRDPNLKRSYDVFAALPAFLETFDADEETLTKYIIGTVGAVDTPKTASMYDAACMTAYMNGLTMEKRQQNRTEMLNTTAADIRALAAPVREALAMNCLCVIGSAGRIEEDKSLFEHVEDLI